MSPRLNFFLGLTILLVTLCIGWQYTVYREDKLKLTYELSLLQETHVSLQEALQLTQKKEVLEAATKKIEQKFPIGDYKDESFLKSIRTICLLNGTSYYLSDKNIRPFPIYTDKTFHFKISGAKKAVWKIFPEIDKMARLISWKSLCSQKQRNHSRRLEMSISFTIHNFHTDTFRSKNYIKEPDLTIHTWLPPFTYQLFAIGEEAQKKYIHLASTPNAEEQLRLLDMYKWKKKRFLQMESILKHLESTQIPLESLLETIPRCRPSQ